MKIKQRKLAEFSSQDEDECIQSDYSYEQSIECHKKRITKFKLKNKEQKKKKEIKRIFNKSFWTLQENLLYRQFLMENQILIMGSKYIHKSLKLNIQMSQLVFTRSAEQCRSHHQKMLKFHNKSIESIIQYLNRQQIKNKKLIQQVKKTQIVKLAEIVEKKEKLKDYFFQEMQSQRYNRQKDSLQLDFLGEEQKNCFKIQDVLTY